MHNACKEFFDRIAHDWRKNSPLSESDIEKLFKNIKIKRGGRVLDVGCGAGVLDGYLSRRGYRVDAVDISEKMIEKAKRNNAGLDINYFAADFYAFTGKYDAALVFDAYPHFTDKKAFKERAYDLLEAGGALWIFFDCGRGAVNGFHDGHPCEISVPLKSAKEEAETFLPLFETVYLRDDEEGYYIGLKKR